MSQSSVPPKQYYVSDDPDEVPAGFDCRRLGPWRVVFDSSYTARRVVADDEHVGYIVGTVYDVGGGWGDGAIDIGAHGADRRTVASFESLLGDFVGAYVALVHTDSKSYLYTDPGGACPIVYDSSLRVAGASPSALPAVDTDGRFRAELFERISGEYDDIWLPGGVTYYSDVRRLLPNHRLDLLTWETSRYWPTDPTSVATAADTDALIDDVVAHLRGVFETVLENYSNPVLALTAGMDSRTLLAVARDWAVGADLSCFTWETGERYDVDRDVARQITVENDIEWQAVPTVQSTEADKERWFEYTGHAVGSNIVDMYRSFENLDADLHVVGIGGEIARAYNWTDSDDAETTFTARELLDRIHRPQHPTLVSAVGNWLEDAAEFDTYTMLDLAHQEFRLGGWAGPQSRVSAQYVDEVMPFEYRPVVRAVYRLPPEVRRNDELMPRIIHRTWPELDTYPYNSYEDYRAYIQKGSEYKRKVKVSLTDPARASDYLIRRLRNRT